MTWTDAHQRVYDSDLSTRDLKALAVEAGLQPDPVEQLRKNNPAEYERLWTRAEATVAQREQARQQREQARQDRQQRDQDVRDPLCWGR